MPKKILMKMTQPTDMTLNVAFNKFINEKKVKNLSDESIYYYERCYKPFAEFFGEDSLCINITKDVLNEYMELLHNDDTKTPITINTHLRGIRTFFNYFAENGYMNYVKVEMIRTQKPLKETYTDEEVQKLIRKPDLKKCSFVELRTWAMICYLLATGNRVSTMLNVKIDDLNFESQEIRLCKTKNKKSYIIPMASSLRSVLQSYLSYRGGEKDDFVFCTIFGETPARNSVGDAIRDYNHSRGVERSGVHLFRHTFAKNWIMQGGDIFRLQKMLGHSSLEMVKEYVTIFGGDLQRSFDKFNTLDNFSESIEVKKKIKKMR